MVLVENACSTSETRPPALNRQLCRRLAPAGQAAEDCFSADVVRPRGEPYVHQFAQLRCDQRWGVRHIDVSTGASVGSGTVPVLSNPKCSYIGTFARLLDSR